MNKIPNRQAICEVLMKHAETDKDIVVLCSDSRGSASLTPFANAYPEQFVEMGIAEQDLVSVSAGLAKCGKKAFAASPACFLSTRSYEQAKIEMLPYAATLFPYMQAVRFLADYINGDTYYQTKYEGHNLVRTKAQYKLYLEAKAAVPEMKAYIAGLL